MKPASFIRILHWTDPNSERVNLATYVYGDGFGPVWRTLADWSRAAAFIGWSEEVVKDAVDSMIADMAAWSPFQLHTQWRHEMSCLQLTPPHPTIRGGAHDELADHAAETFLGRGG
jgi:hypothetical protein